jgi:hypothetical protein
LQPLQLSTCIFVALPSHCCHRDFSVIP